MNRKFTALRQLARAAFGQRSVVAEVERVPASQGDDTFTARASFTSRARSAFNMNATPGQFRVTVQVDGDEENEVAGLLVAILVDLARPAPRRKTRLADVIETMLPRRRT